MPPAMHFQSRPVLRYRFFAAAILWALTLCSLNARSALAHPEDDVGNVGNLSRGISTEGGTMIEFGDEGESVYVLVGASVPGIKRQGGEHGDETTLYFWVSLRAFVPVGATDSSVAPLPVAGVTITPVTRIHGPHDGVTTSMRFVPIDVRRDVLGGIQWTASVQAIGLAYSIERPLHVGHGHEGEDSHADHDQERAELEVFARIAVDLVGVRIAQSLTEELFAGGQLGTLQSTAGIRWNLSEVTSLVLSIGGRGGAALGALHHEGGREAAVYADAELFGQIQLLLATRFMPLNLRLEGGYHLFGLSPLAPESDGGDEHDHHEGEGHGAHGHPFLAISVGGMF